MKQRILAFLSPIALGGIILGVGLATAASGPTPVIKSVGQSATLSWVLPTTYTTGASIPSTVAVTTNVYVAAQAAGTTCGTPSFGSPAASGVSGTKWVTPAYTAPGVYCYDVTAVANGAESVPSNIVEVDVGNPIPNPPTGLTVN